MLLLAELHGGSRHEQTLIPGVHRGCPTPQDENTAMLQQIGQLGYPPDAAGYFDFFNTFF